MARGNAANSARVGATERAALVCGVTTKRMYATLGFGYARFS